MLLFCTNEMNTVFREGGAWPHDETDSFREADTGQE